VRASFPKKATAFQEAIVMITLSANQPSSNGIPGSHCNDHPVGESTIKQISF